ncbi:hypothetical protein [uncultured Actinomyces sp.]|uniref:hypothetical protein n=1 Tax=uncultured Actinomyces sp. TaxID=249061 RepID=UPI00267237B3|nr:hypothetical protein [uncultured Actinomyces sp.]
MGAVALVCVLVGLLGVTVLRPPTQQVSSVDSATDLIMTRDNVLSIVKDDVKVTATSKSGAPVTLVIGTSQDAKGWIGNAAYTEVIGIEADRNKLKAESHAANGTGLVNPNVSSQPGSQSGVHSNAQSGVQSGAEPIADPTSAQLTDQLAKSPMWFKQESGAGSVSIDLENVPSGRSAVAASAGGPDDLTLTLTWKVEQTNMLAIIAFLAACVFALIALALFLTRWQLLRLRKIRAQRIEERRKADSLETSSINSAEVAERIAAARESGPASAPAPAVDEAAEADSAKEQVEEPVAENAAENPEEYAEDTSRNSVWGAAAFAATPDQALASAPSAEDTAIREAIVVEPDAEPVVRESIVGVPAPDYSEPSAPQEYAPDPMTDTFERRGRHGLDNGPVDEDPPERATTDTGVIDLSGIRGGRTLPSRRALREARNKGEEVVVVDGQEFNTGLIPITRPRSAEEQVPAPAPAPTSAPDDDASATGGWTSIMSGWLKDRQGGQQ